MFWKKKCKVCGSKVEKGYDFCPHCGSSLKEKEGLLDEIDEMNENNGFGFGMNLNSFPFNDLMKKLTKDLERSFQDIDKQIKVDDKKNKMASGGLSISITSNNGAPQIKVKSFGDDMQGIKIDGMPIFPEAPKQMKQQSIKEKKLTKEQQSRIENLQKTEPQTSVRRLANKVIYEIDLPGVKEKDVIINKLQNSIEIKALAKDRIFFKLIPVSLPILRHNLKNNKLVLELRPEA